MEQRLWNVDKYVVSPVKQTATTSRPLVVGDASRYFDITYSLCDNGDVLCEHEERNGAVKRVLYACCSVTFAITDFADIIRMRGEAAWYRLQDQDC